MLIVRIALSALILFFAFAAHSILDPTAMIASGRVAGMQLTNSDTNFIAAFAMMRFLGGIAGVLSVATFVLLVVVWWPYLRRAAAAAVAALTALLMLFVIAAPAHAFYSATDVTEAYGILPNHTAFWIPGTGDTKNNQAQMENEDFLQNNKVPGKFFIIPHVKLSGSTYMGWDKYIPTGRLIVVDRAPFFHEWTRPGRGTDPGADQSFRCHSKDNIEVSAEMSMASSVTEENAAKFLFYFGVNPPAGDPANPEVIFTSVFQGRSLAQVMSSWGRGEIQSRVCRHILEHTIEDLAINGNEVLNAIQGEAMKFFAGFGITVEYIGWAGGFSYPDEVRNAINTRFAAEHIQPVLATLETKARIDALSGWDRHLPQSVTLLGDFGAILSSVIGALHPLTK